MNSREVPSKAGQLSRLEEDIFGELSLVSTFLGVLSSQSAPLGELLKIVPRSDAVIFQCDFDQGFRKFCFVRDYPCRSS